MMWRILLLFASPAWADSVVATRAIAAKSAITAQDVTMVAMAIPQAFSNLTDVLGQEARVAIRAGQALTAGDIGPDVTIKRNALVTLAYRAGGLFITTEGRALDAGAVGDVIDVMNLSSRSRVLGQIGPDGVVHVGEKTGD